MFSIMQLLEGECIMYNKCARCGGAYVEVIEIGAVLVKCIMCGRAPSSSIKTSKHKSKAA